MHEKADILTEHLQQHFKYDTFRQGQEEIIQDVLNGYSVLGVLPTGSGKSLCYQLAAKLLSGTTIVVSPLISLMIDQVKELQSIHFKDVVALNSFMEFEERRQVYQKLSTYKIIYVSPELLQNPEVRFYIEQIQISLFVIDEAHCISQWGHEFRPDYLKLSSVINSLGNPPIMALSATAPKNVREDIISILQRPQMIEHVYPMDRENIAFHIEKTASRQEKLEKIIEVLSIYRVPSLIYFSSRRIAEEIAGMLANKLSHLRIAFYHSGMEQMDRISIQQQFMNDQLDVICCTSAFGMGINKSNIRLIIHYHFPSQLESFIQEVGRAGRDGKESVSLVLYSEGDQYFPAAMIRRELPSEEELMYVFEQLERISKENRSLKMTEQEIEKNFKINEVQWRFIHYQIEINGIIENERLYFNQDLWRQSFQQINSHRKNRIIVKEMKLKQIMTWLNSEHCLRKHLYINFQHSYKQATFQCCTHCGFTFSQWEPEYQMDEPQRFHSWESKLKSLLLIEGNHETK